MVRRKLLKPSCCVLDSCLDISRRIHLRSIDMAIKPPSPWRVIGTVRLRKERKVERSADTYRVTSITPRKAEFAQSIDGEVVRHLAATLAGKTVTVEDAEKELRTSGLRLPYQYGYKLHFFAQDILIILVASGQASQTKVGRRFEYHIA